MPNYARPDTATNHVLAWSAHTADAVEEDAAADADEPPDRARRQDRAAEQQELSATRHMFQKTTILQRPKIHAESLLTRALQSQSEDDMVDDGATGSTNTRRRRSITSNTSLASTAGLTSDTGISTPRTNSPSPRLDALGFAPVHVYHHDAKAAVAANSTQLYSNDVTPKAAGQQDKQNNAAPSAAQEPAPQRKRCISFACAAVKTTPPASSTSKPARAVSLVGVTMPAAPDDTPKPAYAQLALPAQPVQLAPSAQPLQLKRPCIKFACPARPSADLHKPQSSVSKVDGQDRRKATRKPSPAPEPRSPTAVRKLLRGSSSGRSPRSATRSTGSRRSSHSPLATRSKKYYNAEPADLDGESSRFHEFASDAPLEDDWIRLDKAAIRKRLTIDDTLEKELAIRRLGKEAEEEAEQEEREEDDENEDDEDEDNADDGENDEDNDDENDEDDEDDENEDDVDEEDTVEGENDHGPSDALFSGYSSGDDASDGYNTDNEVGFASSDEEEDDGLVLWTVNQTGHARHEMNYDNDHSTLLQHTTPMFRRLSIDEHSDSSAFVAGQGMRQERPKNRELVTKTRRGAPPELPDSTDFVCGTFDEDRPLEEAYLSHMEARKRGKLVVIPQDIDPSFPTSDPEDEDGNESDRYRERTRREQQQQQQQQTGSADDRFFNLDDIHHDQRDGADRGGRKRGESPRRYRSPPPPKGRGRSPAPRRLFDRFSPGRRLKSPAPKAMAVPILVPPRAPITSPPASPVELAADRARTPFPALAFQPGLTHTKSLPRPSGIFRHQHHAQPAAKPHRRPKANSMAGVRQPQHIRGAIDIVKGLEQKRRRRKEKFQQKYCNRARKGQVPERRTQRGEGAERMREIGLLMAGKMGPKKYVLSV